MKSLNAIILALALPCLLIAQSSINKNYPLGTSKTVSLEFLYGEITVEKYAGNEVIIEGSVEVNGKNGVEHFEITSKKSGSELRIIADADFDDVPNRLTIVMNDGSKIFKDGKNISINNIESQDGVDKVYNGVDVDAVFTIKVPASANLEIESTYGSVTVKDYWEDMKLHSTYGGVDVMLTNPPASPKMDISSTYSNVDLSIPSSVNAVIRMTSGYGQIYTDLDIKPDYKDKKEGCSNGQDITAKLNSGKGSIKLEATYSNVYLRETKAN